MIIRKLFKFEGSHIVRNCSSQRCSHSIHGHSCKVEVFFTSKGFDNGMMVYDFGLMKGNIKDLIDSFDHAYSMWYKETEDFKDFIKKYSDRWIMMPVSPSAEAYAVMLLFIIDKMVKATEFNNGEQNLEVCSVRVHETETGYAEAFLDDLDWFNFSLEYIIFSDSVKSEWKDPLMYDKLINWWESEKKEKLFINPIIKQQV